MCQEKKQDDFVDTSIQGHEGSIKKSKEKPITAAKNNIVNIRTNRKTKNLGNRNGKKKELYG